METQSNVPALTTEQRLENLHKAMEVRLARSKARDDVRNGRRTVASVLDDEMCQGMTVESLIRSVPGIGTAKAAQVMAELGINERRRIRGLGCHQRADLISRFA